MRLELEAGLLALLAQVLELLQGAAASTISVFASISTDAVAQIQVAILNVLYCWLPVGITVDSLYSDHKHFLQFIVSQISCSCESNVKKACSILSKIMTVKEHPRSVFRNDTIFWVLGEIIRAAPTFSIYFGEGADGDVAFALADCVVAIVSAELPLLCRTETFQECIFDLLLTFLSQRPRKLASMTFEVWCNLEDIPSRERHPYLTGVGRGTGSRTESIYTKVLSTLVLQSIFRPTDVEDADDITEFRDSRQVDMSLITSLCYHAHFFRINRESKMFSYLATKRTLLHSSRR